MKHRYERTGGMQIILVSSIKVNWVSAICTKMNNYKEAGPGREY